MISMICRGFIRCVVGELVCKGAGHHAGGHHGMKEFAVLVAFGLGFVILGMLGKVAVHKGKKRGAMPAVVELALTLATLFLLTSAWCFLDAFNWFWLHRIT